MILSFKHKGLKRLFEQGDRSKLPADMVDRIEDILALLDIATGPDDMNRAALRLHQLAGTRKGQWAVTVRSNWRITFVFEDTDVRDVDFVDYH